MCELRVQCPRDVKIAFPGDPPEDIASDWMEENWTEIYHSAVDFLVSQIERNSTGVPEHPHRISVPGTPALKGVIPNAKPGAANL